MHRSGNTGLDTWGRLARKSAGLRFSPFLCLQVSSEVLVLSSQGSGHVFSGQAAHTAHFFAGSILSPLGKQSLHISIPG